MTANVIYPAAFQRQNIEAVEQAPRRTAEQIRLIGEGNALAAAALGAATVQAHAGKKDQARERLLNAARDLAEMYERSRLEEIDVLACTLVRTAQDIRVPRRTWRQRPGSIVGWLRP
jgi:hypothetical protein